MQLQKIDKKTSVLIESLKNDGKQNQEIYEELKDQYSDKTALAHMIHDTPHPYFKEQNKWTYFLLLGITGFFALASVYWWIDGVRSQRDFHAGLVIFLSVPVIALTYFYLVYNYRVTAFKNMTIIPIMFILGNFVLVLFSHDIDWRFWVNISILATIAFLLYQLHSVLLPGYDSNGIVKDSNGNLSIQDW